MRLISSDYSPKLIVGALNLIDDRGQLIIYKSDNEGGIAAEFAAHELVKKDIMTYSHKQIYFPKGVFCEK